MRISRRLRGGIGLLLGTPLLAAYALARLSAAFAAASTGSAAAYVGYPGAGTAELHFSAADRPFYFGMTLLDSIAGAITFGGAALMIAIGSWRRLRNVFRPILSPAQAASWSRLWIASALAWLILTAVFPILAFFSML